MTAITEFIRRHVPRVSVGNVVRKFQNSQAVLTGYLTRVYGEQVAKAIMDGERPSEGPVLSDVLLFPVRSGLDPSEDETAGWAAFSCEQDIIDRYSGTHDTVCILRSPDHVFYFLDAGVPLSYATSVKAPWGKYPMKKVIKAWREGVACEYLPLVLGF